MQEALNYYAHKLMYEIDSWDLQELISHRENVIVIDARSESAFQKEHIPGALSLPHRKMNSQTVEELDRTALIVTYCDGIGCNASTKGALAMTRLGFQVKELIGGLDWWKRDGYQTQGELSGNTSPVCGCE